MKTFLTNLLFLALLAPKVVFADLPGKFEVIIPNIPPVARSLDKVRIDEVFSFTCSHCWELNKQIPLIEKIFEGKLEISARPIGWAGPNPGRLYYIGLEKGKGQQVKDRIFSFVFEQDLAQQINNKEILKNVAILEGLSNEFVTMMESPDIIKKMKDGIAIAEYANVDSTPTLIVENAITTSRDLKNLFELVNALLKEPVENALQKYNTLEKK